MSPRTKEQFEKIRESSKTEILDAALKLFATQGYHATSIAQIAKKAGISKGLMYNYFESKGDLLKNIIGEAYNKFGDMMMEIGTTTDPKIALENLIHLSIRLIRENLTYWKLYMSLVLQSSEQKDLRRVLKDSKVKATEELSELFKALGEKDPNIMANALGTHLDGIGINMASAWGSFPLDEMEAYLIKTYCSNTGKRKKK